MSLFTFSAPRGRGWGGYISPHQGAGGYYQRVTGRRAGMEGHASLVCGKRWKLTAKAAESAGRRSSAPEPGEKADHSAPVVSRGRRGPCGEEDEHPAMANFLSRNSALSRKTACDRVCRWQSFWLRGVFGDESSPVGRLTARAGEKQLVREPPRAPVRPVGHGIPVAMPTFRYFLERALDPAITSG
jgi:hypothetical protein